MTIQSTTSSHYSTVPRFQQAKVPLDLMSKMISNLPFPSRAMGKGLMVAEGSAGNSHVKFIQDTSILWAPKTLVSRSWLEFFEVSFLEFIESAFFYYFAPLGASLAFRKIFQNAAKLKKDQQALMTKTVKEIPKAQFAKVLPAKLATILCGTLITIISGEYALNFVKNLITEKAFKVNEFSDVIQLSKGRLKAHSGDTPVARKAKRRIAQTLAIGAGIFVGSLALAKFGVKGPKTLERVKKLIELFDFRFVTNKAGKVSYDLSQNHLRVMMPIAVAGYIDSARDHLERIEVGTRAPITGFYIAEGSEMVKKAFYTWGISPINRNKKEYKEIFTNPKKSIEIKSLEDLAKEAQKKAAVKLAQQGITSQTAVDKEAMELLKKPFYAKAKLFLVPYSFGIFVVGLLVTVLNQAWTNYRYKLSQHQKRLFLTNANPFSQSLPLIQNHYKPLTRLSQ